MISSLDISRLRNCIIFKYWSLSPWKLGRNIFSGRYRTSFQSTEESVSNSLNEKKLICKVWATWVSAKLFWNEKCCTYLSAPQGKGTPVTIGRDGVCTVCGAGISWLSMVWEAYAGRVEETTFTVIEKTLLGIRVLNYTSPIMFFLLLILNYCQIIIK